MGEGETFEIELVTDPNEDDEAAAMVQRLPGWMGFAGLPMVDGTGRSGEPIAVSAT